GGRAWVATGAEGLRPARAFASGSSAGVVSLAGGRAPVRAGGWLWSTVPCGSQPETCTQEVMLVGVTRTGRRQFVPLGEAGVTGIVGDSRALWLLRKPAAGGQSALERRDPATGTLLRTTRLPRRSRIVSASAGAVWIIRDRVLTRAGIDGRPRRALRGVVTARAVGDEVWAVRANRRDIVRLDPDDGRVRGLAVSPRRLSDTVLATRTHIWFVERGRRGMVVVPRPT
ncbi:MAG: hypothetical protein KDC36_11765, partial [Thermoleophilia bacterium]|nr:hypothetical protein [Thermoleophilia bacterium]